MWFSFASLASRRKSNVRRIWNFSLQHECRQCILVGKAQLTPSLSFNRGKKLSTSRKRVFDCSQKLSWEKQKIPVSLPPFEKVSGPMSSKVDVMKFFSYIITWCMNLLSLSYPLHVCQEACHITARWTVIWKQPDESSIWQCEHNITLKFLLVSLLWYQMVLFDKSPMLSLSWYFGLFLISIHQQCIDVELVLAHFDKSYSEGKWNWCMK